MLDDILLKDTLAITQSVCVYVCEGLSNQLIIFNPRFPEINSLGTQ